MLTFLALASAASTSEFPPMAWNWSQPQRYVVETDVRLPSFMWFRAQRNRDVRVNGFILKAVFDCSGVELSPRKDEVICDVEQASLVGGVQPGDQGRATPVFQEYASVLESARLRLRVRKDGRIAQLDLLDLQARNFRTRNRNETVRLLSRYLAMGFETALAPGGEKSWISNSSLICSLPTLRGTAAPVEGVHIGKLRGDLLETASHSRGLMVAAESANVFTCETTQRSFFEPGVGLVRHSWEMIGEPTPSSPIALGAAGYVYSQRGGLRRIGDETIELGESGEVRGPERSTLQGGIDDGG